MGKAYEVEIDGRTIHIERDSDGKFLIPDVLKSNNHTALKPAHEPICLAQKPREGTFANNVLTWGVGGLNVDGCRVGTFNDGAARSNTPGSGRFKKSPEQFIYGGGKGTQPPMTPLDENKGRWPANFILSYPEDTYRLRDDVTPEQMRELAGWLDENS